MTTECNNQTNNTQSFNNSTSESINQLKAEIVLTKDQLIQLVKGNLQQREPFWVEKVREYNEQAAELIQSDNKVQEALIYLEQSEKILEYAAGCGKNIAKTLIVEVLHNMATCYQIMWDLKKCSNYIEALIYNLNSQLKNSTVSLLSSTSHSKIQMSGSKNNKIGTQIQSVLYKIQKKVQLTQYYLLFCAINSQLKNNDGALVASKKASQLMGSATKQIHQIQELYEVENQGQSQEKVQFIKNVLSQLSKMGVPSLKDECNLNVIIEKLYLIARHYLEVYNGKKVIAYKNLTCTDKKSESIQQMRKTYMQLKKFSIGNIMQLKVKRSTSSQFIQPNDRSLSEMFTYKTIIFQLILNSISYFTMATQLRYLAIALVNERQKSIDKQISQEETKQKRIQTVQFKESQIYHLYSIIVVSKYLPFDVLYVEHLINSYHNHYQKKLLGETSSICSSKQIQELMNVMLLSQNIALVDKQSRDLQKCSTTNQSKNSDSERKSCFREDTGQDNTMVQNSFLTNERYSNENLFEDYYYVKKWDTESSLQKIKSVKYKNKQKSRKRKSKLSRKSHSKSKIQGFKSFKKNQQNVRKGCSFILVADNSSLQKQKKSTFNKGNKQQRQTSNPSKRLPLQHKFDQMKSKDKKQKIKTPGGQKVNHLKVGKASIYHDSQYFNTEKFKQIKIKELDKDRKNHSKKLKSISSRKSSKPKTLKVKNPQKNKNDYQTNRQIQREYFDMISGSKSKRKSNEGRKENNRPSLVKRNTKISHRQLKQNRDSISEITLQKSKRDSFTNKNCMTAGISKIRNSSRSKSHRKIQRKTFQNIGNKVSHFQKYYS